MHSAHTRRVQVGFLETIGLLPFSTRMREALLALRGDESTPPSRAGLSSLGIFAPRLGLATWLGAVRKDRRVPIYNLWNHTQTPPSEGWSVRRTRVQDFRGGRLTYDSHNGTDFIVPPGTLVAAPAPGVVLRVSSEWNRGGLKVFLDHGRGLVTTHNHLARSLVAEGARVERGAAIAVSGYSGLDALMGFPFGAPHVHMNTWLAGRSVDPFARWGQTSLFRVHNAPEPDDGLADDRNFAPTVFCPERVQEGVDRCIHEETRQALQREERLACRAMALLFYANYYPTRFREPPELYEGVFPREPRLDLPFFREDFVGITFERTLG